MLQRLACFALLAAVSTTTIGRADDATKAGIFLVSPAKASFAERLAAKEGRRYLYLRTGQLLDVRHDLPAAGGDVIVVASKGQPMVQDLLAEAKLKAAVAALSPQQYLLRTIDGADGRRVLLVVGGDPVGTLYGAYRLAEHFGARFYLHGDVLPEDRVPLRLPQLDEIGKPLFEHRGIQPFHDFPEGPDWWNADDYQAVIGQLPKLRMNFIGLHTYPPGGVGPEPLVWIGPPAEAGSGGQVKASYPARHFITQNPTGAWGYRPMKTSDYVFGAANLFDRDDYGADYMRDTCPWTGMPPEKCNAVFDCLGEVLHVAFGLAHRLGVQTCVGTEAPLAIPEAVKRRLRAAGKDPADPAVVQELYEGVFRRIAQTHMLDYYWLWTPEGWTWSGCNEAQIRATQADFRAALAAAAKVRAPFTLATCGWVLGPPQSPALFDNTLPKTMPMSCISRTVGNSPVEPGFRRVIGRPKWSIPWMEDDPGLVMPQLWAGRMRRDAADSLAYGCTGLMGIHWRTRVLGPNVAALAQAAWDQSGWNPDLAGPDLARAAKPTDEVDGGTVARFPASAIAGTADPALYQKVRYNLGAYRVRVPNGVYSVTLKFCEPAYAEKGRRIFGVKLQGKAVIEKLDIFATAGKNRALDYTFKDIAVRDGQLRIEFVPVVEYPSIAAFVVQGPAVRKINCGGPAYKDYEADFSGGDHRPRYLPTDDFYADWARAEFGPSVAGPLGKLFARIDCHLPRPGDWTDGPGGIKPNGRPWDEVRKAYLFVDEMAALRPRVVGAGNLERFDYWLDTFRALRAMAKTACTWAQFNAALQHANAEKDPAARKKLAREAVLPARKELLACVGDVQRYLLSTVTTPGELGTVANWQQHNIPQVLGDPGEQLAALLGEPLPAEARPTTRYVGRPRIIVPSVRTAITAGESLRLTVILAGIEPREAVLCWRPLGHGDFASLPLIHTARNVYHVTLPAAALAGDFEYYLRVVDGSGQPLYWPAAAPQLNQSVVVCEP